jgi:hypothetical protein
VRKGQTVVLQYEAEVRGGELLITLENPDGRIVWEASLHGDGSDVVEYVAEERGQHTVLVERQDTAGSFALSWEVR